jgi:hypothetical protein
VGDVQRLIRISGKEPERLRLGRQKIEQREIGGEDQATAISKHKQLENSKIYMENGIKDIQRNEANNDNGVGIGR